MNLHDFDLNLLVALDALLTEQRVTHAGVRLNLSQDPAHLWLRAQLKELAPGVTHRPALAKVTA